MPTHPTPNPIPSKPTALPPPVPTNPALRLINQRESLKSLIRVWLATRDEILWSLVSGVEEPIAEICLDGVTVTELVIRVNALRHLIVDVLAPGLVKSEGLSEDSVNKVLESVIAELLSDETPKFSLSVDGQPRSF
jgi:hypothetical protein